SCKILVTENSRQYMSANNNSEALMKKPGQHPRSHSTTSSKPISCTMARTDWQNATNTDRLGDKALSWHSELNQIDKDSHRAPTQEPDQAMSLATGCNPLS